MTPSPRGWLLTAALLGAPSLALAAPPEAPASRPQPRARVQVKGTRVSLVPPEGFTESHRFSGFQKEAADARIVVEEHPVPRDYDLTLWNVTKQLLGAEGKKLVSRREVKVAGYSGRLLRLGTPTPSGNVPTWVLLFGDASGLVRVEARWREEDTRTLEGALEAALLSAHWAPGAEPTPGPGLFTLKETPGLKEAQRLGSTVIYSRDGSSGLALGLSRQPVFMASASPGAAPGGRSPGAANLHWLRSNSGLERVVVESSAPLTVAGLRGHELVARAKHSASGEELTVYQALLVDADRHFILQGKVGHTDRAEYLGHFKAATRAFQPVNRPGGPSSRAARATPPCPHTQTTGV